jgi:acyl carrier protein
MTKEEIRNAVLQSLASVAPEADLSSLKPLVDLRDQVDIDSMDFLNFVIALDKTLHVAVPETDYPKISTIEGCVEYLAARMAKPPKLEDEL